MQLLTLGVLGESLLFTLSSPPQDGLVREFCFQPLPPQGPASGGGLRRKGMPARIATKVRTKHEKLLTLGRAVGAHIMYEVHNIHDNARTRKHEKHMENMVTHCGSSATSALRQLRHILQLGSSTVMPGPRRANCRRHVGLSWPARSWGVRGVHKEH